MKNTRLIGLMLELLIPILFAVFVFSGCEEITEITYVVEGGYETIDGEYRIKVTEVEDTCSGEISEPWVDILEVLVQEKYEDGTYLADLVLSDEVFMPDVKVEPDGNVDYEYFEAWYGENYLVEGSLTPTTVDVTFVFQILDGGGEVWCYATYDIKGCSRYLNAPPSGECPDM